MVGGGLGAWAILDRFSRHISKNLDQKWSSRGWNWCSYGVLALLAVLQHQPLTSFLKGSCTLGSRQGLLGVGVWQGLPEVRAFMRGTLFSMMCLRNAGNCWLPYLLRGL